MDRPLADKRPVGPFAQSGRFQNELLGSSNDRGVPEDGILYIELIGDGGRDASRMLEDILANPDLEQFVVLQTIGGASGARDVMPGAGDEELEAKYAHVAELRDSEVTLGQITQFIQREISASGIPISDVNIAVIDRL